MFLQAPPYHSKTKLQQQHSFVEVATSYHQLFAAADSINSPIYMFRYSYEAFIQITTHPQLKPLGKT
jgi:hypothetical protein